MRGPIVHAGAVAGASQREPERRVTEPLRGEHRELLPHVEALATAADAVGVAPASEQRRQVHAAHTFLATRLIPHAVAEDEVLYAELDELIGRNGRTRATDTMRRDHVEVGRLTERLGRLGARLHAGTLAPAEQRELRRVLYGLHGIVALHFAKEEEVYLPLLDRTLTAERAERLFEAMQQATVDAGAAHAH